VQGKRTHRTGIIVFAITLWATTAVAWWQRYDIYDWWRLRAYEPPAKVVQLADETTMESSTRKLFYAYHPSLEGRATFNTHCPLTEKTIVLGCYVKNMGIYLYDVTEERLHGVVEVTAAHEALHAAYDRLSGRERGRVDDMLNKTYASIKDERIKKTIEAYRANGADVNNELHSILGTEVRSLPADLETYYRQYFKDRQAVVGFSEKYEKAFTDRKDELARYDQQLKDLKAQIESLTASLKQQVQRIDSEYARLQQLRSTGQTEKYNAGVSGYNQGVNAYNANARRVEDLINQYNTIVERRNTIALEENQLQKALDSRPATIQTQ
jgi:hypothetical protein